LTPRGVGAVSVARPTRSVAFSSGWRIYLAGLGVLRPPVHRDWQLV
jgi:hypothetical protein